MLDKAGALTFLGRLEASRHASRTRS
jgi:hypothetical protein